jgi:hypothetical protein
MGTGSLLSIERSAYDPKRTLEFAPIGAERFIRNVQEEFLVAFSQLEP